MPDNVMQDLTTSPSASGTHPQNGDDLRGFLQGVSQTMQGPTGGLPVRSTVAVLIQHGGFQLLCSPGRISKRLHKHLPYAEDEKQMLEAGRSDNATGAGQLEQVATLQLKRDQDVSIAANLMRQKASMFFQKLCPDCYYGIPSSLMSHLAFPYEGRTFTGRNELEAENKAIPSAFTFVGQFVDHDLTFNGLNLFDVQTNTTSRPIPVDGSDPIKVDPNLASPQVDLDSVYGRKYPKDPKDPSLKELLNLEGLKHIFAGPRFRLTKLGPNAYDLPRWTDAKAPNREGAAWIFDPRNDENQLILQIHILVQRVHNKLVDNMQPPVPPSDGSTLQNPTTAEQQIIDEVRKQVVCLWQSVLLNDFLPRVCKPDVLAQVLAPGYQFHYVPGLFGMLRMPHEFALAYRFGHSMLRSAYKLNGGPAVPLFDNRNTTKGSDLRGNVDLPPSHVIDWDVFLPHDESKATLALLIDSHVTPVVFDLPESAIPDDIKTDGNLPKRNLDRSRSIELGCGEDIAAYFGVPDVLAPIEVEPDATKHDLFTKDVNIYQTVNGKDVLVTTDPFEGHNDPRFKTPLWYYVLREAEVREGGVRLGTLGSYITAEVIVQGIMFGKYSYSAAGCAEKELLPGKKGKEIKLRDLIDFVYET